MGEVLRCSGATAEGAPASGRGGIAADRPEPAERPAPWPTLRFRTIGRQASPRAARGQGKGPEAVSYGPQLWCGHALDHLNVDLQVRGFQTWERSHKEESTNRRAS